MSGFAIGTKLGLGVVGGLTRQIDNQINVYPNGGNAAILFGAPVARSGEKVIPWASTSVAADFVGIAVRIVKTNETYGMSDPKYLPDEPVDVLTRGGIAVECVKDATATSDPTAGGKVFIRVATGVFVAAAEGAAGADTIELPNAIWANSGRDASGLAEITLLESRA